MKARSARGWIIGIVTCIAVITLAIRWALPAGSPRGLTELPAGRSTSIDLLAQVEGFVASIPGPGSEGYDPPAATERERMASAFRALSDGRVLEAESLARPLGYAVVRATDNATGRGLLILAERKRADGSWPHGWGLYVHSVSSSFAVTVEAPHALDDLHTDRIAVEAFRAVNAANLLVAGASRFAKDDGSADLAHSPSSIFEAIHEALLRPGVVVFEPHGFDEEQHRGYGDIVVSSGSPEPDQVAAGVAQSLGAAGFDVCLFTGEDCAELGATENVQGLSTRGAGGHFVHVEMAEEIRRDPAKGREVAAAIAKALGSVDSSTSSVTRNTAPPRNMTPRGAPGVNRTPDTV